ncbi:Hypothetical_protein [Hexamita inflata]|uniref:Hypothetical_protein n=1 Tax=Hexamita inflata TaxID=28002 RepID=A0AA86RGR4_9EUKA|nr:Hypothetical protein HINF_LOCUS65869 [Hexamita inflata]
MITVKSRQKTLGYTRVYTRAGFCAQNAYKNKKCAHFDAHSVRRVHTCACAHIFQNANINFNFLKNIIQFCHQMLYFELVLLIVILNVVNMLTLQPYEDTQKSYMLE